MCVQVSHVIRVFTSSFPHFFAVCSTNLCISFPVLQTKISFYINIGSIVTSKVNIVTKSRRPMGRLLRYVCEWGSITDFTPAVC